MIVIRSSIVNDFAKHDAIEAFDFVITRLRDLVLGQFTQPVVANFGVFGDDGPAPAISVQKCPNFNEHVVHSHLSLVIYS